MKPNYLTIKFLLTLPILFWSFCGFSATFVVDNLADTDNAAAYTLADGTNTLRKCIRLANANANTPVVDIINFNGLAPAALYTINIGATLGNLPFITDPVRIDGFTASGAVVPTPIVVLKGAGAGPSPINNVFNFTAGGSNSIIRGFVIYKTLNDAIYINGSTGVTIEGCWVGILETGAAAATNNQVKGHGIYMVGGSNNCVIGTTTAKNVISANVGHGIVCVGSSNVSFKNNYIGTNVAGTAALGNGIHGLNIDNSPSAIIGGSAANEGNLISGNTSMGITIFNLSTTSTIKGNKIGTDLAGTAAIPNAVHGINIDNSTGAVIGGSAAGEGNLISGNTQTGIVITNASSNAFIRGNKIGTNLAGTAAIGNGVHGISIYTNVLTTQIGGPVSGDGNLISGNGQNGIDNTASSHNTIIQGNYIGVNATGAAAIGNGTHGIFLGNSDGITIGGNTSLMRNIISGNGTAGGENGIGVVTCNNLNIRGNFVGTDATGTIAIRNFDTGLSITTSTGNTIGGAAAGEGNLFSGNGIYGIYLFDVDNTTFTANYIGTTVTGNAPLGNLTHGAHSDGGCNLNTWTGNVVGGNGSGATGNGLDLLAMTNSTFYGNYIGLGIDGITDVGNVKIGLRFGIASSGNTIGGTGAGQRNYVSGNGDHGIFFDGQSVNNTIKNNYVGSDVTGMIAVGNYGAGIFFLDESNNNMVGGTAANEGNLMCCSGSAEGLRLQISNNITAYGNLIGVNITGAIATGFGNNQDGVLMGSYWNLGAINNNNIIGGLGTGQRNIIAANGRDGVHLGVWGGSNGTNFNPIIGNSIYCNAGLGINMEANLANENEGVPAPVVTSSTATTVGGTGIAGYTIHVYRNQYTDGARCDCEGEIYVGTVVVGGGGTWSLTHSLGLTAAQALSVTATQTKGTNSTSEFWVCSVPLPVDLLALDAIRKPSQIDVQFTVTNESNILYYFIERSNDGVHFEQVGTVVPKNLKGSVTTYVFEDLAPLEGSNFYRIKTVENNGKESHSKITQVNFNSGSVYVYPNPAEEELSVMASNKITQLEIYSSLGQLVAQHSVDALQKTVSLNGVAPGIYMVKVYQGLEASLFKIEKK